jgi:hypothetical protein
MVGLFLVIERKFSWVVDMAQGGKGREGRGRETYCL